MNAGKTILKHGYKKIELDNSILMNRSVEKEPAFFDRFTIWLTPEEAEKGAHAGRCDDDIAYLLTTDAIKNQISTIQPDYIREELEGYGAWDEEELADDEANQSRILWIACGNVKEELASKGE